MRRAIVFVASTISITALVAACSQSQGGSDGVEGFSNGDTVTIVVPADPGGGYDTEARLLQPKLQEALSEQTGVNVNVRIENAPGADGRIGAQRVYDARAGEDLVWYYFTNTLVGSYIDDGDKADYEPSEFKPLAVWGYGPSAIALPDSAALPERTIEDLSARSQNESLLVGSTGLDREIKILEKGLQDGGLPFDTSIVEADGTSTMIGLLLRNDIQLAYSTGAGLAPFVEAEAKLEFLASMACEPDPALPDVPTIVELDWPNAGEICENVTSPRTFLGAPTLSDTKVQDLVEAFETVLSDPEFQSEAADKGQYVDAGGPDAALDAITSKMELYEQLG